MGTRQAMVTEIEVDAALVDRVAAILSTYRELQEQADLYQSLADEENAKIKALMEEAGISKMEVDGVSCTIVGGTSSGLDKIKFVQLGGSLEQLANATVSKPKKKYLLIGEEKKKRKEAA